MTDYHKQERYKCGREKVTYSLDQWKKEIFSDEKKFITVLMDSHTIRMILTNRKSCSQNVKMEEIVLCFEQLVLTME